VRHLLLATLFLSAPAAQGKLTPQREYRLRLFNTHTHERIDVVYRRGDTYDAAALERLDLLLRDWRTDEVKSHDPRLFDLLADLAAGLRQEKAEIHIICGYRAPVTNKRLRTRSSGVASNSLHMRAAAMDIRLPGVPTSRLRDTALKLRRGGVGYYPGSDFVHVDVGRVRRW
jgi:uncharacterized protein YcbK (DUF882 family)